MTKILIAGTDYGLQNVGDDAILGAMLEQFRSLDGVEITVATKNAGPMAEWLGVKTVECAGKFNLLKVYRAIFSADVLVVGGACVISDYQAGLKGLISGYPGFGITLIATAKLLGKPVMVYAIGVEEIHSKLKKLFVKWAYNLADVITLRDQGSLDLLRDGFGVTKPKMEVTADPVMGMSAPSELSVKEQAAKLGCFKDDKPVVAISFAYGVDTRAELIQFVADMSDYVVNVLGAIVLFIPMNIIASNDRAGVLKVVEKMERSDAVEVLELPYGYEEVLALLGSVDLVISSRMHLLIFSSITMTPIVGISRVPKTNQYLNFFGLKSLVSTDNLEFSSVRSDLADAWENRDAIKNALQSNREEMFNRSWQNFRLFKDNIISR